MTLPVNVMFYEYKQYIEKYLKSCENGDRVIAQQLKAFPTLPEDSSSVLNTHNRHFTTTCNSSYNRSRGSDAHFQPSWTALTWHVLTQIDTHTFTPMNTF